ncbi:MAG: error-prone DNA polymerase [Pirellulaceae bacterium]|nr:error-prone DNA polymerase [Pirellulaceae bacterium]
MYVELHCKSNFSFLEGASHADELIEQASKLGYAGLAITDRNSLAGVVRGFTAAKEANLQYIVGCELHFIDGPPMVVWPSDRAAYGRLCRLITLGRSRCPKGMCELSWNDLSSYSDGLLAGMMLRQPQPMRPNASDAISESTQPALIEDAAWGQWLDRFRELFGDRGYLLSHLHLGVDDASKLERHIQYSIDSKVPLLAAGDVHYHVPERMLMHDLLLAIASGKTIAEAAAARPPNSQFSLRSIEPLKRLYSKHPAAIERTIEVAQRCSFQLDSLRYEYPLESAPSGTTAIEHLKQLAWQGAKRRYPDGVPEKIIGLLRHEFQLIEELHYEAYFLTVWDLVRFARSRGILCQGRGSAANSVVCYCLGVTSVDPNELDLLFERFISRERGEAPDIDVDFEHQRREEVLQYIYEKYGRDRAGMTATVITYRTRSAVRDCGKALGISLDRIDALSKVVDGRSGSESLAERCKMGGLEPESEVGKRFLYLTQTLIGFPRHLSQHTGGMVMTQGPLCELCPIENAAMAGRTVIQWDKNDLDELGILKVDCLALGMLSAIHRSFDFLASHHQTPHTLASIPQEDSAVYDMICRADTIGVFQIESRAQMSMLPRLKPRTFYDLVIEVAIVRPGPIQGQMVHPYLQARQTGIQPEYPTPEIAHVLSKTLGVPIFQEQAMRLAVVAAGFTPGEADQLRRAMAAWRRPGLIDQFRRKLIDGMLARGLSQAFAENVFMQLRGFGEYGFPESHAASFALLVYVSCWLKHYYPAVFCASLLNSQPLGFYAPSQLVQDAIKHGVEVRGVDINSSDWDCTLEPIANDASSRYALRLGLRMVDGLGEATAQPIVEHRTRTGIYRDSNDLMRRTRIGQGAVTLLANSGVLESIAGDRRAALWQSLAIDRSGKESPLFDFAGTDDDEPAPESLTPMQPLEQVYADYASTGLSLRGHPIEFCRPELERLRVTTAEKLSSIPHGRFVHVAGLVLLRQRPSTAKGITFVTLEDETGSMNLVIRPTVWERFYPVCKQSNAWLVHGVLESRQSVIHIVAGRIEDLSQYVSGLKIESRDFR